MNSSFGDPNPQFIFHEFLQYRPISLGETDQKFLKL